MLILFLFLSLVLSIIWAQNSINKKYFVEKNINVNTSVGQIWFIGSLTKRNKMLCMAECNLNDACYTVTFNTNLNNNCFLYNKYFDSNETIQTISSDLYKKECNYTVLILILKFPVITKILKFFT
jgi:hypothetical protein